MIENISDIDEDTYQDILRFNYWAIAPFLQDEYKFTKDYLNQGLDFVEFFTKKPFKVVRDYVFSDRAFHGLFSLFEQMEVVINMREFRKICGLTK